MRIRMVLPLFVFASLALCACVAQAQTAADITAEPHHRLLLGNDQVRVFALALKPTEQSYVKYDHDFLLVMLEDCEIVMWSEGQSPIANFVFRQGDTQFLYSGPPRGFRNDRNQPCRMVIVEFFDPKATVFGYQPASGRWEYGPSAIGTATDPRAKFTNTLPIGAGVVSYSQLLPGDSLPSPEKGTAELLIPVTDVDFKMEGDAHIRKSSGQAVWLGTGRKSDLTNAGVDPARFAVVQLRTATGK